jgi:5'-3' exonuclease
MKLLLVDLSGLFWQCWATSNDRRAMTWTISILNKHYHQYDKVAVCLDGPPYVRSEWYPDYKGDRGERPENAVDLLGELIETLENDNGFPVFSVRGWEADDVIATLAKQYKNEDVTILTADKDLWPVVGLSDTIQVLSPRKDSVPMDKAGLFDKTGCTPKQYEFLLALKGGHDNIPGIKGIGKGLGQSIARIVNDADELAEKLMDDPDSIPRNTLFQPSEVENLKLWHKLVKLNYDLPIEVNRLVKEDEVKEETDVVEEPTTETVEKPMEIIQAAPAKIEGSNWQNALEPTDLESAYKMSRVLLQSRLFSNFGSEQSVFAALVMGRELGLGATASLNGIYVVQGKPTLKTETMVALVLRSGKADYLKVTESTKERCTVKTHRNDDPDPDPTVVTFTIDDAKRLGLANRDQWKKQPATMCMWRAYAKLIRMTFPEVTLGLYGYEEMV